MTQLSDEGEIRRRMMQAIEQARLGIGTTSPNPPVGAVIYRGMKLIGEGYHERAGEAHAEIRAIQDAKKRGNGHLLRGSELYVTLEPCSSYGKTPPCTEAIISEGIGRVYYGVKDPDGRHQGRADAILRVAGIEVAGGSFKTMDVCREEEKTVGGGKDSDHIGWTNRQKGRGEENQRRRGSALCASIACGERRHSGRWQDGTGR